MISTWRTALIVSALEWKAVNEMIGPQAYENLFQTSVDFSTKSVSIKHEGMRYTYHIVAGDWELFGSHAKFKAWCEADVRDNDGGYADAVEVIE